MTANVKDKMTTEIEFTEKNSYVENKMFPEHIDVNVLIAFLESITDAEGPYPEINGTAVVYDAFKALRKMKGENNER